MLDILRKNSKHWLVVTLMAVVAIGLTLFFGYSSRDTASGISWAAKVDGDTIKMGEFLTRYKNVVEMYRRRLGPSFDEKMLESLNIKYQILAAMVMDRIIAKEAHKNGLDVSQAELVNYISKVPYFQKDGKFDLEYYKAMLRYNRMTAHEFETMQRRDLIKEKMRAVIMASSKASQEEINDAYKIENQRVKLSFIKLDEASGSSAEVKDSEIRSFLATEDGKKEVKDYYTKHNSEFIDAKKAVIKFDDAKQDIAKRILSNRKENQAVSSKVDAAMKLGDINKAAKLLNAKVATTEAFNRKAFNVPKILGSNTNDVLWAFGVDKKLNKREIAGKIYLVSLKDSEMAKAVDSKKNDEFKRNYLAERGNIEFAAYIDDLKKKWSNKVAYSPAVTRGLDYTGGGEGPITDY